MVQTSISNSEQILDNIPPVYRAQRFTLEGMQKQFIIVPRDFELEELKKFLPFFRNLSEQWVRCESMFEVEEVQADVPCRVPQVNLSRCLRHEHIQTLAYVALVQGYNAGNIGKMMVRYCRGELASAIYAEVANGYSIMFTAALSKGDLIKLSTGPVTMFDMVEVVNRGNDLADGDDHPGVKIWCASR
jgi:hypothetical protein